MPRGNEPSCYPYTFKVWADGSSVLIPDSLAQVAKSVSGRRTKATPRKRSDDMKKLAKVHGWSRWQLRRRTLKVIEANGGRDYYVPNTKKAREIRPLKSVEYVGISGRVDGDYDGVSEIAIARRDQLRAKVREAVAQGIIDKFDVPRWAR